MGEPRNRDDPRWFPGRTERGHHLLGDAQRLAAGALDPFGEIRSRRSEPPFGDRDRVDRDAGRERLGDEMLTLEQHPIALRAGAGELAESRHDRVLTAREAAHSRHFIRLPRFALRAAADESRLALRRDKRANIEGEMKARILKKFEEEIQKLDRELKAELPKEIQRARELGDLRENAEYQAAKERQRLVESRISLLQKRVSDISLMNLDKLPNDRVGFGSTVHLKDAKEQIVVYQLVMPEDADVEQGFISTASPIGRALLNKEEGDEVSVTAPNGSKRFEIIKLLTIHDEETSARPCRCDHA